MEEQELPSSDDTTPLPGRLHEIAELLRRTHHLGPETQQALAALADDLGSIFEQSKTSPGASAPLMDSIAHVARALHASEERGPLNSARQRLQDIATSVEGRAPRAAAFVDRLLEALANIGI
jgi:hypothetical protein